MTSSSSSKAISANSPRSSDQKSSEMSHDCCRASHRSTISAPRPVHPASAKGLTAADGGYALTPLGRDLLVAVEPLMEWPERWAKAQPTAD